MAGSTRLLHGRFNGALAALPFPRAHYPSKLPLRRAAFDLQSTTFATGVPLVSISSAPLLTTDQPPCRRPRSNGALSTFACHSAAAATTPPHRPRTSSDILTSLAIAVAIPVVSGMLVSLFNAANVDWYNKLRKPDWNPPSWLFGAAWGVLYAVMGFASWLVWARGGWDIHGYALSIYALQLVLNLAWPVIFFGVKHMGLALADIVALWVSLFACIRAFQVINPLAGRLLYPYLAWVTFATALNYKYWQLNRA
ncbi:hypothetical protein L7F22_015872 [Adiantum nelumboides]|nr:hypothetical protein [Adiantum nelumboides]